ncbi:MAG: hypothetical protein MR793_05985 [Bacteroidales bacterium]|nr:hypothetical protein [Bacteroidales bacterium]
MNKQQSKEEQLEIIQGELQKAIDTFQLSTAVLCLYLKVMVEYGLSKPNIYDYFTEFPVADILNDCMATILSTSISLKKYPVGGAYLPAWEKTKVLHQDAVEIDAFMNFYLDRPIVGEASYLNSIEQQMNCARQEFNIVDFAYWWSVWNITKVKGYLDNSFWENRPQLTDKALLDTLNEFLEILMTKDSQWNYIHDVFKNPSMDIDWAVPCEALNLAIKCLKHFIELDDLPEA